MKITKLILSKSVRLGLSNTQYFEYIPTEVHQVIIGTNGSGKSTVMSELSPLPSNKNDFHSGGYKLLECTHNGHEYQIWNGFEGRSFKYSFIKNNTQLNEGGTQPAQKALVKQEFGLTPEIYDLLLGNTRFTQMTPNVRREWFTKFGGGDMRFALNVYNELKKRHREAKTMQKHFDARLVETTANLLSSQQIEELTNSVNVLKEEITELMSAKNPNVEDYRVIESRLESIREVISSSLVDYNRTKDYYLPKELFEYNTIEKLQYRATQLKTNLENTDATLNTTQDKLASIENILESLKQNNASTVEELLGQLSSLESEYNSLRNTSDIFSISEEVDASKLWVTTEAIFDSLVGYYTRLPDNSKGLYTKANKTKSEGSLNSTIAEIRQCNNKLDNIQHRLEHLSKTDDVVCPKCNNRFRVGEYDSKESLLEKQISYTNKLEELENSKKDIESYIEDYKEYVSHYRAINEIKHNNPSMSVLWEVLATVDLSTTHPSKCIDYIQQWKVYMECELQAWHVKDKIKLLKITLAHAKQLEDKDNENVLSKYDALKDTVEECIVKSRLLKSETSLVDKAIRISSTRRSAIETVVDKTEELNSTVVKAMDIMVNDILHTAILERQSELASKESTLSRIDGQLRVIEDLRISNEKANTDKTIYSLLEKEISPLDGLIARQSKLFIDSFIKEVNTIINGIWEYDLVIHSCNIESESLTYKFPLSIKDSMTTPDIKNSSMGQRDIIDFAFRIVATKYLGLHNYPLYLDELAPTLDEKHSDNIMYFIKLYVESKNCTQLFMISHFIKSHGVFPYAEVCMMDDSNVLNLPKEYNKHVVLQ